MIDQRNRPRLRAPAPGRGARGRVIWVGFALFALGFGFTPLSAQRPASAAADGARLFRYVANESGGSIVLESPGPDSAAIAAIRLELLESAAAIRRGDLRWIRWMRAEGPPARVLAENRHRVRCTVRSLARGGEVVLLSNDTEVVAAIHAVLTAGPPVLDEKP